MRKLNPNVKFLFCLLTFLLFLSCSASAPNYKKYPGTLTPIERKFQYQNDTCFYYQQYSEIDLRCTDRAKERDKILFIIEYRNLKREKLLPILYNSKGPADMTFDDFHRFVK